jgi:hypothetical protein
MSAVVVCCFQLAPGPEQAEIRGLNELKSIYQANRGAFAFGTVRFEYQVGSAANSDRARMGEFQEKWTGTGLYAFDGTNYRFDLLYSDADLAATTRVVSGSESVRQQSSRLRPTSLVTDGQRTLEHHITYLVPSGKKVHQAQIISGTEYFWSSVSIPLLIGCSTRSGAFPLDAIVDRALNGDPNMRLTKYTAAVPYEGRDVAFFELTHGDGPASQGTTRYWVDRERGAIPVHIRWEHGTKTVDLFHDKISLVTQAGWFPHIESTSFDGGKRVARTVIKEIDCESLPQPSAFQLQFEEPIALIDQSRSLTYSSTRKTWGLRDLPKEGAYGVNKFSNLGVGPPPAPPQMPGERSARDAMLPFIVLSVLGAIAAAAGFLFWRRR